MRIITGEYKGRRLMTPKTNDIRPTSDKVKEAIFDLLIPYVKEGCVCLDLFSGTGNLGLEALSRGSARVYFSDSSRDSIKLTKENIKICGAEERSILLSGDYKSNIKRIREKLDIVFLDPPYESNYYEYAMQIIREADILNEGGILVCEHSSKDEFPEEYCGFTAIKDRTYGQIGVTIYE